MPNLSKFKEITDLRTIRQDEALDFTPWLFQYENMMLLADTVGFDITVEETEFLIGDFQVEILASQTGTDQRIIIESQQDTNPTLLSPTA